MRWRILILPAAAVTIFAAVEIRLAQESIPDAQQSAAVSPVPPQQRALAPVFEARNAELKFFRLDRYLGRHGVFVVFFDRQPGAAGSDVLQYLKAHSSDLDRNGARVVGVSCALPQENRKWECPESFELVTDLEEQWEVHRQWGLFDETSRRTRAATFYIDRAGFIEIRNGFPVPLQEPILEINERLGIAR